MRVAVVHMIDEKPTTAPRSVRTRCGRTIDRPIVAANESLTRYTATAFNGNVFQCTTSERAVSCVKCQNIISQSAVYKKMAAILKDKWA